MLFALLGEARQVSNPELEALIGFRLVGEERRRLNDRKLVESTKVARGAFAHELSDAGWRWCAQDLAAGPAGRGSSLERAHYLVFGVFARYLSAAGLSLAEFVAPPLDAAATPERTLLAGRAAATRLMWRRALRPGTWNSRPRAASSSSCASCASGWRTYRAPTWIRRSQ